ncbi:hypothetical protein B0T16DRAFT_410741 [Cercophora newfieldiana]|uniref:Secreted protein n=1 Tax=Cercophora newfieldiana TaxID=92897 RepID=A0AA39YE38_9PEZI|nr:hypothetical protein B0T16DRAFT_410741 [Cercophora newfieldiana]
MGSPVLVRILPALLWVSLKTVGRLFKLSASGSSKHEPSQFSASSLWILMTTLRGRSGFPARRKRNAATRRGSRV